MKNHFRIMLVLILVLTTFLSGCGGADVETQTGSQTGIQTSNGEYPTMTLSIAALSSENTAKSYDARLFIDLVTEKSGGAITFDEYFNASLGVATANLETIGNGIADVGQVCNLYTPSALPLAQISYCMPFSPKDPTMVAAIMEQISEKYPEFYEEYEKNNVHLLAYKGNEPYKIYSKEVWKSLKDLNGKKITMGGIYYLPWFESQGAVPISAPAADLYQTIKTGVASGSFVYDSLYCEYKLYEVEKNVYDVGMGARNNDQLCINLDVWNNLDEKTKALLEECAHEALNQFHVWESEKMAEWQQEMSNNGCQFVDMTDEDKTVWAEEALAHKDTIKQWIDEVTAAGYDGAAIMSDYLQIAEHLGWNWAFDSSKYK